MHRREFLAATAGAVAAGAITNTALGSTATSLGSWLAAEGGGPIDAAAFHAMRQFAQTPFGRIAYVERGNGPAALFMHGAPLNGFQWRGALERLSADRRCIAPDLMGLGYSEIPEGQNLEPETQAEMCAALLDAFKIKAVDLVGSDSGGAIAQIFVARYPKRVRSLLLTNCDVYDDSPPQVLAPVIAGSRKGTLVDEMLVPWLADKEKARAGLGTAYTNPTNLTDEAIEVYLRPATTSPLRKAQFHGYHIALERNALLPILLELKRSTVPVRVVWGTGDTIFKQSGPDSLGQIFPRFRGTRKVEGAKLFWPEEFPDIVAEEARKLWAGR
jgi:haloalkane dehalogenase